VELYTFREIKKMKKESLLNEVRKMQKIAGIIKEYEDSDLPNSLFFDDSEQEVTFPNGLHFELGGEDPEGGIVIGIEKEEGKYAISGMEWNPDRDDPVGEEGYTHYYDFEGNELNS
jgi:hypothetical protein